METSAVLGIFYMLIGSGIGAQYAVETDSDYVRDKLGWVLTGINFWPFMLIAEYFDRRNDS